MFWLNGFIFTVLCANTQSLLQRRYIDIKQNGYEGLTIAISRGIDTNVPLLNRLQDTFREASAFLYKATRNRLYFKNITIVIPSTWSSATTYEKTVGDEYSIANVIFEYPQIVGEERPYVRGLTECGVISKYAYMSITPYFVARGSEKGKTLVHEWAHLRWGVFDEYPELKYTQLNKYPSYYMSGKGTAELNVCNAQVKGEFKKNGCWSTETCNVVISNPMDASCVFCPADTNARASLMGYSSSIPSIDEFCDNSTDKNIQHNKEANTAQNRLCQHRSVWEVLADHEDFQGIVPGPDSQNTDPVFKIVQQGEIKMVLVLDVSGSMRRCSDSTYGTNCPNDTRIAKLVEVCKMFINKIDINDGKWLGLVEFSTNARITKRLTKINSAAAKDDIIASLPKVDEPFGSTAIGKGLKLGIEVLKNGSANINGASLILVTDGKQNVDPKIEVVSKDITEAGVVVTSLAFSSDSDNTLMAFAADTGGRSFFYSGSARSTALLDSFLQIVSPSADSGNMIVQIDSTAITIASGKPFIDQFHIDDSIGLDTELSVFCPDSSVISVSVISPNKTEYQISNEAVLKIPGIAETGNYKYTIKSTTKSQIVCTVSIDSHQRSSTTPVVGVQAWLSSTEMDYTATSPLKLYAIVSQGSLPIFNVNVEAVLENENGYSHTIGLNDNGNGADLEANDGIYTTYLLPNHLVDKGRHNIKIYVVNNDSSAEILESIPMRRRRDVNTESETRIFSVRQASKFKRVSQAGDFNINEIIPNPKDIYPPSQIKAIKLEEFNENNITLTWKAVGDDFDLGNATSYDVRISSEFELLLKTPDNATKLTEDIPKPGPPGSVEYLTIVLDKSQPTVFIGIRAVDDSGNVGSISNIVTYSTNYISKQSNSITVNSNGNLGLIIGLVVPIVIIIIFVVVVFVLMRIMRKKPSQTQYAAKPHEFDGLL